MLQAEQFKRLKQLIVLNVGNVSYGSKNVFHENLLKLNQIFVFKVFKFLFFLPH